MTAHDPRAAALSAGRSCSRSGNRRSISAPMSGATSTPLITSPSIRPENLALTRSASFQTVSVRLISLNVRPDQSSKPGIAKT
jgi:hypothetical protein